VESALLILVQKSIDRGRSQTSRDAGCIFESQS
jgi:hypothetical protein